ncbi:DNA replication licensing factor MCM3, putative [Babesia caballi]|uniref:DNA replication licensing factor MCM3, putative n=1 Tax=Babesia caballi TaxID=5871 RepID=A0AAV4M0B4_BABCB|nr:DNA replication licensing factor MCM3, putative [Babesia caballi]
MAGARGYVNRSRTAPSPSQSTSTNTERMFTVSEMGTSKSAVSFTEEYASSGDAYMSNRRGSTHSSSSDADRQRQLENMHHQILAEYEGAREDITIYQRSYRAAVERFLSFASENKQIYGKVMDLYRQVEKEFEKSQTSTAAQLAVHLRVVVNVSLLYFRGEDSKSSLAQMLIRSPYMTYQAFQDAIQEVWRAHSSKLSVAPPKLGICGWLGRNHVTPRGLSSNMINSLVAVEGVVNKCSSVYPKLSQSIYVGEPIYDMLHENEKTVHLRQHYDLTDFTKTVRDNGLPPTADPEGKIVHRQEIGLSSYKNYQTFVIQETPEDSFTGQMPRYVSVIVQDDLCNVVQCGDRVRVWGVYRAGCGRADDSNNGIGRGYLVANYVSIRNKLSTKMSSEITDEDRDKFRQLAQRDDCLSILTRSVAPSICGHELVKRGLLLALVGGPESDEGSDHRIRGDVHVLLVGDPGCGKSQMLRFVMNLLPGTVSTTGRGSTGVGLTAAVITDQDTGERRVEGGAMVMGDRRVVCIDEFDKMQPNDRVAIHEVMEQQTVTVAKAGIHTTLNARCTVFAAANPLYGCWSEDMDVSQQLCFERSLISRFDLIFVVRDAATEVEDERIAEAVLRNLTQKSKVVTANQNSAQSGRPGATPSCVIQPVEGDMNQVAIANATFDGYHWEEQWISSTGTPSRQKKAKSAGKGGDNFLKSRSEMTYIDCEGVEHDIVDSAFLRKYLHYCKHLFYREMEAMEGWRPCPEISESARREIVILYSQLRTRAQQAEKERLKLPQAVTPRTLEAIIRLCVAYSKLQLKRWVTTECVAAVGKLLNYTLFGDAYDLFEVEMEADSDADDEPMDQDQPKRARPRRTVSEDVAMETPAGELESGEAAHAGATSSPSRAKSAAAASAPADDHTETLLACLRQLDAGDGVDLSDLYIEFSRTVRMSMDEFKSFLLTLHNQEPSPIVYSEEAYMRFDPSVRGRRHLPAPATARCACWWRDYRTTSPTERDELSAPYLTDQCNISLFVGLNYSIRLEKLGDVVDGERRGGPDDEELNHIKVQDGAVHALVRVVQFSHRLALLGLVVLNVHDFTGEFAEVLREVRYLVLLGRRVRVDFVVRVPAVLVAPVGDFDGQRQLRRHRQVPRLPLAVDADIVRAFLLGDERDASCTAVGATDLSLTPGWQVIQVGALQHVFSLVGYAHDAEAR